ANMLACLSCVPRIHASKDTICAILTCDMIFRVEKILKRGVFQHPARAWRATGPDSRKGNTMIAKRGRIALYTASSALCAVGLAMHATGKRPAVAAEDAKLVFGLPGIPPVYGALVAYVALGAGFYKKYGVDLELRPYESGTVAAQALAKRENDVAFSPTGI